MKLSFPLVLDGATGTELIRRGYDRGRCAEAWILEHPAALEDLQGGYAEAGSQVLYAPTFGANAAVLSHCGLESRVEELNSRLVALSRRIAGNRAMVAGDISPTGLMLCPGGSADFEDIYAVYHEQAEALEKAGVDLFVIETMMTLPEARAALLAVKDVSRKPVMVSFTCDGRGRTVTGTDVTAALTVLEAMGAEVFGLNCSAGPREMMPQLRRLGELTHIPLLAKPNAGLPKTEKGVTAYDCTPEEFAQLTSEMAAFGACALGGCCGTDREYIAALAEKMKTVPVKVPENPVIPCLASERKRFPLSEITDEGEIMDCDEELEENLLDSEGEDTELLTLRLTDEAGVEAFAQCQYAAARPVCFTGDDAFLLEKALRAYQGRAMYWGELPGETLATLTRKYGLVIRS